ncbi:peptidylprolyl isomerase [Aestuariibaculum suncheonense]|uniref:peptidylprolyl isomerase n=1 Tax=Aestuariibaculum suncheonense TaxID=1028745 RepID=A0A8J6QKV7_9FLAO|nr:peptidylprolyl isomerase [Aestuariibaculum suncheonense]MBD0836481.1 peptidylprolyl isomerase [Aestuariibaculum suncheonense]
MNPLKISIKLLFIVTLITNLTSCKAQYPELEDGMYAEFVTSKGIMVAKLAYDKTPVTVANFVSLAEGTNTMVDKQFKGKKFYNGTTFHRVIDSFMIQGGDPYGNGSGGPGYKFSDEFSPELKHDKAGILSMANSGPNTNGSQFFITDKPTPFLDNKHSVFGELVIGLDVEDSISKVKTGMMDAPIDTVYIKELNIIRKGKEAKRFDAPDIFVNHFIEAERLEKEKAAKMEALLKETKERFEQQKAEATTLPSGLKYYISKKGDGNKLPSTAIILTDYSLYMEDGKLFDTSKLELAEAHEIVNPGKRDAGMYRPIEAEISPDARMIPGFKEGLQQLSVGDKATLFIPYHLGYGEMGNRGIPPRANLIFEVEIIEAL